MKSHFEAEEYKNLINALQAFEEDWLFDLGLEACRDSLKRQKEGGLLDFVSLKSEYQNCLSDENFDWKQLALDSYLFTEIELYDNWHIRSIVEFYLEEFINSDETLGLNERVDISHKITAILQGSENWVKVIELLLLLKDDFPKLRAYHIFNYMDYFSLELKILKENRNRLWVIDAISLA